MNFKTLSIIFSLAGSSIAFAGVNINTLDAETLAADLDGIGLSKAEAIVEYRNTHGDFESIDDLVNVKGIGEATVEKNREVIEITTNSLPEKK